jgi:hypothetical protein
MKMKKWAQSRQSECSKQSSIRKQKNLTLLCTLHTTTVGGHNLKAWAGPAVTVFMMAQPANDHPFDFFFLVPMPQQSAIHPSKCI